MVDEATGTSQLSRRRLLTGAAGVGAVAVAGSRISSAKASPKRSRFVHAPAFQGSGKIVLAMTDVDAAKVQPLLDEYKEANNVEVEVQQAPHDDLYTKLNLSLSAMTGDLDVVSLDDPWIPQFAGGEFLMNLDELLDARGATVDTDFVPELLALGDFPAGSGHIGIPWVGNVQVYVYRTDVFEELGLAEPKTYDDVLAAAQAITDAKSGEGLYGMGLRGQPTNPAATSFLPTLRGHGVDIFAADAWEPQLETEQAMQAITTHLTLAGLAPPGVENVGHAENGRNFYEGLTAQSADIWPDLLLQIFDPEISKVIDKVAIAPQPVQAGAKTSNMAGNWLLAIPNGSKNAEAALDFILWMTAPEQQKRLMLDQQIPATRISVLEDPEAVEKLPFLPGVLAAGRNALPRPRTPSYTEVETILGTNVASAIADQISGEEAMTTANSDIRELMIRNGELEG
jgi:multiple sugar transport system substrate-binding protein